jgi:glycosyltransferase involved in cell wall biosynthesis
VRHNLLFVIDNLEFGGGERVFSQLINRLSRERYKIMVACLPTGIFVEKIKGSGALIKPVDMKNRSNFKIILQLIGLMKEQKIDIVHSQGARADFFARMAAMFAKVSIVISTVPMTVEGFDVSPIRKLIYKTFSRFSERFVDRFMVVSHAMEKMMIEKHRIEPQKVIKIYNGIETDDFCLADDEIVRRRTGFRNELGLGEGIPVIGVIGRLVWQKGFEYFIEAIPEVLKEFKEAKFLIVGDGPLENKLKVAGKKLKIDDKIIFTGFKREIKEVLTAIDIFVIPSLLEGLPMILLESMAMAKPIIATDIEGMQEVLENGITGLLVPPRDPKVLSESIIELLNHRDKAYLIGATARKVVEERFSVDVMVQRVEGVYEELLQLNLK